MALYLPLDGDTLDYSGHNRHGQAKGLQYDSYLKKKGMAGYFDGQSYVFVSSMRGYVPALITRCVLSPLKESRTPQRTYIIEKIM